MQYRHQSFHRPPEEWTQQCRDCGTLFDKEHDLREHLKWKKCPKLMENYKKTFGGCNETEKPSPVFICSVCDAQYKSYQKFKFHEFSHTGAKPHVCDTCGKRFRCPNNLYQHKFTHGSAKKYKCKLCPKIFKRLSGLNQVN